MTQVDRAISALLDRWLSPKQLTAVSGRANPQGITRDSRAEAARRGLTWREIWVRDAITNRKYKMHHLERSEAERAGSSVAASGGEGDGPVQLDQTSQHDRPVSEYAERMARLDRLAEKQKGERKQLGLEI